MSRALVKVPTAPNFSWFPKFGLFWKASMPWVRTVKIAASLTAFVRIASTMMLTLHPIVAKLVDAVTLEKMGASKMEDAK